MVSTLSLLSLVACAISFDATSNITLAGNSSRGAAANASEACAFARQFLAGSAETDLASVCSCVDAAAAREAAATRAASAVLPAAPAQGWLWWGGGGDDDDDAASSDACEDLCACARGALDLSATLCDGMCALVGALRSRAVSRTSRELMAGWIGVPLLVVGSAALRLHAGKRARARSWYEPIPR